MRRTARNPARRYRAFTLIEIVVAAFLLSVSFAAITTLWSVSRRITEHSRNNAEYYAIARQEVERYQAIGFTDIFNDPAATYYDSVTNTSTAPFTDYDQNGKPAADPPATTPYYRATSTFALVRTSGEDNMRRLGVQTIQVFPITDGVVGTTAFYQTIVFLTSMSV